LQRFAGEGRPASDLRWTKPEVSDQPLFFDDAAALDEWCRTDNEARPLTGKWHLVPVQKGTLRLLRRSNRLHRGQYQRPAKRGQEDDGEEGHQAKRLRRG
jgi:hypothetical protein